MLLVAAEQTTLVQLVVFFFLNKRAMALETSVGTCGPFWQPPNAYLTLDLK